MIRQKPTSPVGNAGCNLKPVGLRSAKLGTSVRSCPKTYALKKFKINVVDSTLRSVALLGLLVGAALVVSPVVLFPNAGEAECINEIDRVAESDIPEPVDTLQYSALSPAAQRVFDMARMAEDGETTVYGERCPEEFIYADYTEVNYIQNGTDYYELQTHGVGGFKFLSMERLIEAGAVFIGLLIMIGGWGLLRYRERVS